MKRTSNDGTINRRQQEDVQLPRSEEYAQVQQKSTVKLGPAVFSPIDPNNNRSSGSGC